MSMAFAVCLLASGGSLYVIANASHPSLSTAETDTADSAEGMEIVAQDLVSALNSVSGFEAGSFTVRFGPVRTELAAAMINEFDEQGYQLESLYRAESVNRLSTETTRSITEISSFVRCSLTISRLKLYRDYEETKGGLVAAGPVYVQREQAAGSTGVGVAAAAFADS